MRCPQLTALLGFGLMALSMAISAMAAKAFYLDPTLVSTQIEDRRPGMIKRTEAPPPIQIAQYDGASDPWFTKHPSVLRSH